MRRVLYLVKENEGRCRSRYGKQLQDLLDGRQLCGIRFERAMSNDWTECKLQEGYSGPR